MIGIELAKVMVKEYLAGSFDMNGRSVPKVQRICDYEEEVYAK